MLKDCRVPFWTHPEWFQIPFCQKAACVSGQAIETPWGCTQNGVHVCASGKAPELRPSKLYIVMRPDGHNRLPDTSMRKRPCCFPAFVRFQSLWLVRGIVVVKDMMDCVAMSCARNNLKNVWWTCPRIRCPPKSQSSYPFRGLQAMLTIAGSKKKLFLNSDTQRERERERDREIVNSWLISQQPGRSHLAAVCLTCGEADIQKL